MLGHLKNVLKVIDIRRKWKQAFLTRVNTKNKGVRGTPSFVIGRSTDFGINGEFLTGAMLLDAFEKKLKDIGSDNLRPPHETKYKGGKDKWIGG
jgi:hypothetical protein